MTASVPELTILTSSMEGNAFFTRSASSTSRAVGAPKLVPLGAAFLSAAITFGWACPRIMGPQDPT